jgi:hypothetical protein
MFLSCEQRKFYFDELLVNLYSPSCQDMYTLQGPCNLVLSGVT